MLFDTIQTAINGIQSPVVPIETFDDLCNIILGCHLTDHIILNDEGKLIYAVSKILFGCHFTDYITLDDVGKVLDGHSLFLCHRAVSITRSLAWSRIFMPRNESRLLVRRPF